VKIQAKKQAALSQVMIWLQLNFFYLFKNFANMCLRTHNKSSIFGNIFSKIEKVLIIFSIFEKIFPKIDDLICALRAHINRTLYSI